MFDFVFDLPVPVLNPLMEMLFNMLFFAFGLFSYVVQSPILLMAVIISLIPVFVALFRLLFSDK